MPNEFQPDPKRSGRNQFVESCTGPEYRLIPLPFTPDSLRQVLDWGSQPDAAPYSHWEIAEWCVHCDQWFKRFMDFYDSIEMKAAICVAADVDCQWEEFLANTYNLDQLRSREYSTAKLPTEWFTNWKSQLIEPTPPAT